MKHLIPGLFFGLLLVPLFFEGLGAPSRSATSYVVHRQLGQVNGVMLSDDIAGNPLYPDRVGLTNPAAAPPPRYSVTDLGPGGFVFAPTGLNNAGQVVGSGVSTGLKFHAFLWENGTVTDLHPDNASDSYAEDINDARQVVGFLVPNPYDYLRGFLWQDGALQVLDAGASFQPFAVNNNGLIAGRAWFSGRGVAVLWENGGLRQLFPGSEKESGAVEVNDAGQVVGWIKDGGQDRAFLWQTDENGDSQTTMLGTLGGKNSHPYAIDEFGIVVGGSQLSNGVSHAFVWVGGVMTDLGTQETNYSVAYDINEALQIVGYDSEFFNGTFIDRAVLWQGPQIWHLNSLIPVDSGWDLQRAFYINDKGQIVGQGRRNGDEALRIFLLTPLVGIDDLRAEPGVLPGHVDLRWTAPDGEGSAAPTGYDIRYSQSPIDETTWADATQVQDEPAPSAPGQEEVYTATELTTGVRWYFAVKVRRADGSWSPLSNVPSLLDLGFRPPSDGYAFANFSGSLDTDLTYDDMIRMFDSRADVCYNDSGPCRPRETAAAWRLQALKTAAAGHCLGFSTTALRFFKGLDNPVAFQPGAVNVYDLAKANVRSNLTFYQVRQYNLPWAAYRNAQLAKPPSAHLTELKNALADGAPDPVTLSVYEKIGERFTGHAVVPYAVEERQDDWQVWLYDNNSPGMSATLLITPTTESWLYHDLTGSIRWSGNANTRSLAVTAISEIARPSVCPYCAASPAPNALAAGSAATGARNNGEAHVWLTDAGRLLIRDSQGRRIGHVGDELVNEIPGASANLIAGGLGIPIEPIYTLPLGETYEIDLDGRGIAGGQTASLVQFGPGYATGATAIPIDASTLDRVVIAGDGRRVMYLASAVKQVNLLLAVDESDSQGYRLELQGVDLAPGAAVAAEIDAGNGRLVYRHHGAGVGQYAIAVRRSDAMGQRHFFHGGVAVAAGDIHRLDFAGWDGAGAIMLEIDRGGDGTIDETAALENRFVGVFLPLVMRR